MIVNVRLVYVSADHKGMITLGKALGKFYAQPVGFFRSDLTGAERLAHMIGSLPAMRVTVGLRMQSSFWQSDSTLPRPDECEVRTM